MSWHGFDHGRRATGTVTLGKSVVTRTTSGAFDRSPEARTAATCPSPSLAPASTAIDPAGVSNNVAAACRTPSRTLASASSDSRTLPYWPTSSRNSVIASMVGRGTSPRDAWLRYVCPSRAAYICRGSNAPSASRVAPGAFTTTTPLDKRRLEQPYRKARQAPSASSCLAGYDAPRPGWHDRARARASLRIAPPWLQDHQCTGKGVLAAWVRYTARPAYAAIRRACWETAKRGICGRTGQADGSLSQELQPLLPG